MKNLKIFSKPGVLICSTFPFIFNEGAKAGNPDFNYGEFAIIKSQAGLNSYKLSVKEWVGKTNAIGLKAKTGRYGGTYAYKDIAFEFGMWISPEFKST